MKQSGLTATSHPFVVLDFPGVDEEEPAVKGLQPRKPGVREIINQRLPFVALTIVLPGIKSARSKENVSLSIQCNEGKSTKEQR